MLMIRLRLMKLQYGYGRGFMFSACRKVLKIELKIKEKKTILI